MNSGICERDGMQDVIEQIRVIATEAKLAVDTLRGHIQNGGMLNAGEIPGMVALIDVVDLAVIDLQRAVSIVAPPPVSDPNFNEVTGDHSSSFTAPAGPTGTEVDNEDGGSTMVLKAGDNPGMTEDETASADLGPTTVEGPGDPVIQTGGDSVVAGTNDLGGMPAPDATALPAEAAEGQAAG